MKDPMRRLLPALSIILAAVAGGVLITGFVVMPVVDGWQRSADRCPVPKVLTVRNVTETSAEIVWTSSDSAISVDLRWRLAGDPDWNVIHDAESPTVLADLMPCRDYEFELQAHCSVNSSAFTHTLTFEADGCCRIPSDIHQTSSADSSAAFSWDRVSFAFLYTLRYRASDDTVWTFLSVDTNAVMIHGLEPCTSYLLEVLSRCDLDSTEYSASLHFQTSACGACTAREYCQAFADDATQEWIDSVAYGTLRLRTGPNDGYLLLNTEQTAIERKRAYQFHITPGSITDGSMFYLRMWIDLDQDGVFTDSTELLVDPEDPITGPYQQEIVLPDTIPLGLTRMRIALKVVSAGDTIRPESCGTFLFGEVEDYCIRITDPCPEALVSLYHAGETNALLTWEPVDPAVGFIYRHRAVGDEDWSDLMVTQDTFVVIGELSKCTGYQFQILSVCIQDTSSLKSFFFETECPNSIHEVAGSITVTALAYPNPFSDRFYVLLEAEQPGQAYISLHDLNGRQLRTQVFQLREHESHRTEFDELADLPGGMYFLQLQMDNYRQVLKLIKL